MSTEMRDGSAVADPRLGRLHHPDPRDRAYPMSAVVPPPEPGRRWRYWWPSGWWGDQGAEPWCVAYSLLHTLADGPRALSPAPALNPRQVYCRAQQLDPWPGDCADPRYGGTSVRAGAQTLVEAGLATAYRWAWDVDTVAGCLLEVGPVVVGTRWHQGMNQPDEEGLLRPEGPVLGGHAYVLNGVNLDRGRVRVKNSWGRSWGIRGGAWLRVDDLATLLADDGEACLPIPAGGV